MTSPTTDRPAPSGSDTPAGNSGPDSAVGSQSEGTDGRQLRRRRNRETVVDALLDLYRDGNLRPSTEEIAARSGLSPRSLFRYFDDVDDLTRTAISRIEARAVELLPIAADPSDDVALKIKAVVDQRFRLFDAVGNAAAVSRLRAPFQPILAERLRDNRALLRGQLETLFAHEFEHLGDAVALQTLATVDILSSFESHQLLLQDLGLSGAQARASMAAGLTAILVGTGR